MSRSLVSMMPERRLWQAVVVQAIRDALKSEVALGKGDPFARKTRERQAQALSGQARAWIESNGEDFRRACAAAGVDPARVQAALVRWGDVPAEECPWARHKRFPLQKRAEE